MNVRFVLYLLGYLLIFISPLPAVCAVVAMFNSDRFRDREVLSFVIPMVIMLTVGGFLYLAFRKYRSESLLRRDGIGTVALGWLIVCMVGSLPFYIQGAPFAHALFESVSGFTTTGSTILSEIESLPPSLLLWRSLSQWIGGIGILVLLVALFTRLGIRGRALVGAESSVNIGSATTAKIRDLAGHLLLVYVSLTVLCFLSLLAVGWMSEARVTAFEALLFSMCTVATGGFAPHSKSVGHFDSFAVEGVFIFFMFISAISFVLLYRVIFRFDVSRKDGWDEAKGLIVIVALVFCLVSTDVAVHEEATLGEAARSVAFPVVSMATSSGFGTVDYDAWPLMSKVLLAFLMMIGGCGGSTAGGLKVMRFLLLLRILKVEVQKTFRPNLVVSVQLDGQKIDENNQHRVLIYVVTVGLFLFLSTGVVSMMEPGMTDFETAFGAVIGTFLNMGPGFGEVGPTDNFGRLHSHTLLFLSWLMLIGRLEIFVFLALFSPSFWK